MWKTRAPGHALGKRGRRRRSAAGTLASPTLNLKSSPVRTRASERRGREGARAGGRRLFSVIWLVTSSLAPTLGACDRERQRAPRTQDAAAAALPAAGAPRATATLDPEDGQWTRPAKSLNAIRYSQLDEISAANVRALRPAWSFSLGVLRGHEEAPLVVNNTMYVVTPYPNLLYALDLTKPGAPMKWVYNPKPESAAQGVACCDVVNRGAVYEGGRIFYNTLDN